MIFFLKINTRLKTFEEQDYLWRLFKSLIFAPIGLENIILVLICAHYLPWWWRRGGSRAWCEFFPQNVRASTLGLSYTLQQNSLFAIIKFVMILSSAAWPKSMFCWEEGQSVERIYHNSFKKSAYKSDLWAWGQPIDSWNNFWLLNEAEQAVGARVERVSASGIIGIHPLLPPSWQSRIKMSHFFELHETCGKWDMTVVIEQ